MLSHADNNEDPAPQAPSSKALRTERLSPDEARAVIDLWQAERMEQTGLTDQPALPDVAEGLDLSVEDVQRLLAEVRTRREAESRLLAQEQELAEIRLAEQQRRVAEEQRKLAEIQRQRAELERKTEDVQRQTAPRPIPPKRLLRRLPQEDAPCWRGAPTFSPEDEAAELLAEHRAEEEQTRNAASVSWPLIAFLILMALGAYLWHFWTHH